MVLLTLPVNVNSGLRKTLGGWKFAYGGPNTLSRTHLWIEDLVSGCNAPHLARCPGKFSRCAALSVGAFLDAKMVTKWFHSTRLETRTKESNICASSRVAKPAGVMKVTAGIFAPATDQSILRGLSMSTSVRTRKMVNYA